MKPSKPDLQNFQVAWQPAIVPGRWTVQATVQTYQVPIGITWFGFSSQGDLEIDSVFTSHLLRRRGVATKLHQALRETYPYARFVTGHSSGPGQGWLKSLGYRQYLKWGWGLRPKVNCRAKTDS